MEAKIATVAVVGAGTMGQGIVQVCAAAGFSVKLFDADANAASRGLANIRDNVLTLVARGKLSSAKADELLARVSIQHRLAEVKADLIIEAIVENLDVKRQLLKDLEANNTEHSILASNTSSISVTQMAAVLQHPERVAGLHFFNPATLMRLVEVIAGAKTSTATIQRLLRFVEQIGKQGVAAADAPGFIVNRVARHYYVESLKLLEEGVATHAQIDALLRGSGFKMGAFELMDLIGLDVNFAVTSSLFEAFHYDPKFRPSRIQQQKVDAGFLGRKTGKGFYEYPDAK